MLSLNPSTNAGDVGDTSNVAFNATPSPDPSHPKKMGRSNQAKHAYLGTMKSGLRW